MNPVRGRGFVVNVLFITGGAMNCRPVIFPRRQSALMTVPSGSSSKINANKWHPLTMETKINIRKAVMRDAETIAEYNILMAKETEKKDLDKQTVIRGVKAVIKDPHKGFYLVAEAGGGKGIIGQLLVTNEWSDWRNKYFFWIQSVYVREDFRQQGVFASLYRHLEDIGHYKKNVAGLRLYVEKNNKNAQTTYESMGMYNPGYEMYEVLF